MNHSERLYLHEEVMLLALAEERGTIEIGAWYHQAVGGAVLAELLLAERIRLVQSGSKPLVEATQRRHVGDEFIDQWLDRIASDPKRRRVSHWASRIAGTKDLKNRVAQGLVRRGILRVEESKVLLIFSRKLYPELDPRPERALRERLRTAIFGDASDTDPRTVVLVSLAKGTGLLQVVFDKKDLRARSGRIESLIAGEATGKAARDLVRATTVAITTACITPVIIS